MRDKVLDLELLHIFCVVTETKYLSEAAKQLNITTSAVAQSIRKLEGILKTNLFFRGQRPLKITPAGRRLLNEGLPILRAVQSLQSDFTSIELPQVSLRLGLSETITATLSPWIVSTVQSKVAELEVHSMLNKTLTEMLRKDELDVCLYSEALLGESQWCRVPIFEEDYLGVSSKNISRIESLQQLKELAASHPYICYTDESYDRELTDRFLLSLDIKPRIRIQTSSSYCLVGLVDQTNGWSILPPTNLWCGRQFTHEINYWALPNDSHLTRRMWALGKSRFETEIRWLADLTRSLFRTHTIPELEKISIDIASCVRSLS